MVSRPWWGLWPLARRLAWQQGRQGVLRGFVLSLALAIATMLCVVLVADRVQQALGQSSREFLAADLVLQSASPIPLDWLQPPQAETGSAVTQTIGFSSMLFNGEQMQLASVKAVSAGYPFYGELKLQPAQPVRPGEIWLSARLMTLLQAKAGDLIQLGQRELKVAGLLLQEPDESFSPFLLAPQALMHLDDVASAGVLLPGSRIEYRYLFKGSRALIQAWQQQLSPRLQAGQRWLLPGQDTAISQRELARSEQFFRLAALIGVLLGLLAMQIALSHFSGRLHSQVALLKTLGASRQQLWIWLTSLLGLLMLASFVLGSGLGYGLHLMFLRLLGRLLPAELPPPSAWPFVLAGVLALLATLLLAWLPFRQLLATPPNQVLRQTPTPGFSRWLSLCALLSSALLLAWWLTRDGLLSLALLGGGGVLLLALTLVGWGLLRLLPAGTVGTGYALAVRQLRRERWPTLSRLSTVALALLLLGLLWASRDAILQGFDARLQGDTPNRFVLNIAEADRQPLADTLQSLGIPYSTFYPVIRGRLVKVNGEPVSQQEGERGRAGVHRELNMTWAATLPAHNQVTAGAWWGEDASRLVSVEQDLAKRLDLQLGDQLEFQIEGRTVQAKIGSLRAVHWEDMQPNFFMIFSPDVLQDYPASWLASLRVAPDNKQLEYELVRRFPALTLIDTDNLIQRLQGVLQQLSRTLSLMLGLVALAAALVLFSQIQTSLAERWQSMVLMRMLGAGQALLKNALSWELLMLGALAGLAADLGCELALWLLHARWSYLPWQAEPLRWLGLPLLGMGLVWLAGAGSLKRLLSAVLMRYLRS